MTNHTELGRRVIEVVIRSPGCDLEEIVMECGDMTWNQVFFEVDRLSRERQVILYLKQRGQYSVKPLQPEISPSNSSPYAGERDGRLEVHLPKSEKAKPKAIEIKVA